MNQYTIKEPTIKAEIERIALEAAEKYSGNLLQLGDLREIISEAIYFGLQASGQHSQRAYEAKREELRKINPPLDKEGKRIP